jgi:hypothetical protein
MPETPDARTAVYEYGGIGPEFQFGPRVSTTDRPSVACRGVAYDYATPRATDCWSTRGWPAVEAETDDDHNRGDQRVLSLDPPAAGAFHVEQGCQQPGVLRLQLPV